VQGVRGEGAAEQDTGTRVCGKCRELGQAGSGAAVVPGALRNAE